MAPEKQQKNWPLVVGLVVLAIVVLAIVVIPITKGVTRSGDLGLGDGIVGGGTLLLAAATFIMAIKTAALADETREGIRASASQFRQERMPVVMPVGERPAGKPIRVVNERQVMPKRPDAGSDPEPPGTLPYAVERGDRDGQVVNVPIENVGAGPAFGIAASLFFLDQNGERSVASQPTKIRDETLPALGPGQRARLRFAYRGLALPLLSFRLTIEYKDGAGGSYKVTATFVEKNLAYGAVGFEPPPELRLPGFTHAPIPLPDGLPRARLTGGLVGDGYDTLVGQDEGVQD